MFNSKNSSLNSYKILKSDQEALLYSLISSVFFKCTLKVLASWFNNSVITLCHLSNWFTFNFLKK